VDGKSQVKKERRTKVGGGSKTQNLTREGKSGDGKVGGQVALKERGFPTEGQILMEGRRKGSSPKGYKGQNGSNKGEMEERE